MRSRTQVFQSGNSQAVRIPKAFRLRSRTVGIQRTAQGLLISDLDDLARRAALFASLDGSCPDFPEIPSNTSANTPRDFE